MFFFFLELQKQKSHKLPIPEQKQGQFWNLHKILHKTIGSDFRFSGIKYFYCRSKVKKIIFGK